MRDPKKILAWRVHKVGGCHFCFFDPLQENIFVYPLTFSEKLDRLREYGSGDALEAEAEGAFTALNKQQLLPELPTFKEGK